MAVYRKDRVIKSVKSHQTVWYLSSGKVSLKEPAFRGGLPGEIYLHLDTTTNAVQVWMQTVHFEWEDITKRYFGLSGDIVHPEIKPKRVLGIRGPANEPTWLLPSSFKRWSKKQN